VGDAGTIVTSTNGVHWTPRKSGTTSNLQGIAFGAGQFVAVGHTIDGSTDPISRHNTILTSPDGMSWTEQHTGTSNLLYAIAYGNGRWVAAGGVVGTPTLLSSFDGAQWTLWDWRPKDLSIDPPSFTTVTYGQGQFVAAFPGGSLGLPVPSVFISPDGETGPHM
jgi:hypothetical protein